MKTAIESNKNLNGVHVELCNMNNMVDFKNEFSIAGITKYSSFVFSSKKLHFFAIIILEKEKQKI